MEKQLTRRQFVHSVGLALGATVLAACGATPTSTPVPVVKPTAAPQPTPTIPPKPVTLIYVNYSTGTDKALWDQNFAEFNKIYPQITIKYEPTPGDSWGEYFDKLATRIAGGNPPDISRVAIEGARLVVSRGLATPLDDFAKGDPQIDEYLKDVSPKLLDALKVDGKTYEYPYDWNNMCIYYNTKMFEAAGIPFPKKEWTKDEFLEMAKKLTKGDVFGFGFAVQYFSGTLPWMFSNGTSILSEDWTKSNLKDPKVLEVLQFLQDLIWTYKVSPAAPASHTNIYALMASGKLAIAGGGRWPVLQMTTAGFSDFDIQYWPKWKDQVTEFGVGGFVLMKSSKYQQEAWQFLRFMTSKKPFEIIAELGQSIPARRSVAYSDLMTKLPPKNYKLYYDSIEGASGKPVPSPAQYNMVEATWRRYLGKVLANETKPADALAECDKEFTTILSGK